MDDFVLSINKSRKEIMPSVLPLRKRLHVCDEPAKLSLSEEDHGIIRNLRDSGVLKDVEPNKMTSPTGFMALMCADCDQILDNFEHLLEVCGDSCERYRVHPFSLNGGAVALSPESPLSTGAHQGKTFEQIVFQRHIDDARRMKGMELLVNGCHAPCGAAYGAHLNMHEVLRHMFLTKLWIKKAFPALRVICFVHVDFGNKNKGKRTYSVSGTDFWEYADKQRIFS